MMAATYSWVQWTLEILRHFLALSFFFCQAESMPAHTQVTQTVEQLLA
jgi:hypothetical protein